MSSQILSKPLPYLALIIAHLIWGANFVVAKVTLQEFPPMSLAFLRFTLASLLIAPFFLTETKKNLPAGRQVKISKKDLPKLVGVGIFIITLNITFFFEGISKTTVINASALTMIIPILSVFLSWLFLKEKIFLINLLGIIIGGLGALIIIQIPEIIFGNFTPKELLGNILLLFASTSWVIGSILSREMLKKYPSLVVTSIAFLVGVVTFFLPAAREYIQNPEWPKLISVLGLFGLAFMTILSSISAYFLFEWGLAKTSVNRAHLFQYIEPFVAAFLAIAILGERITTPFIFGTVLIAAGVYLGTLSKEPHHKHHKAHRI